MMASTASAVTVVSASATVVIGAPAWTPSELVPDWSARRRLFSGLPLLIIRCIRAAASAGVIAMALAIGKTRLKTEGKGAGAGAC